MSIIIHLYLLFYKLISFPIYQVFKSKYMNTLYIIYTNLCICARMLHIPFFQYIAIVCLRFP